MSIWTPLQSLLQEKQKEKVDQKKQGQGETSSSEASSSEASSSEASNSEASNSEASNSDASAESSSGESESGEGEADSSAPGGSSGGSSSKGEKQYRFVDDEDDEDHPDHESEDHQDQGAEIAECEPGDIRCQEESRGENGAKGSESKIRNYYDKVLEDKAIVTKTDLRNEMVGGNRLKKGAHHHLTDEEKAILPEVEAKERTRVDNGWGKSTLIQATFSIQSEQHVKMIPRPLHEECPLEHRTCL